MLLLRGEQRDSQKAEQRGEALQHRRRAGIQSRWSEYRPRRSFHKEATSPRCQEGRAAAGPLGEERRKSEDGSEHGCCPL
jgi:hypothetical protein